MVQIFSILLISCTSSGSLILFIFGVLFCFLFPGLGSLLFSRSCAILSRDFPKEIFNRKKSHLSTHYYKCISMIYTLMYVGMRVGKKNWSLVVTLGLKIKTLEKAKHDLKTLHPFMWCCYYDRQINYGQHSGLRQPGINILLWKTVKSIKCFQKSKYKSLPSTRSLKR